MCIVYESVGIMGCCIFWIVDEWFVCILVLQVWVDFMEVITCIHDAYTFTFITWFNYDGLVIFAFNAVFYFNIRFL